jgi:hypothetical protein
MKIEKTETKVLKFDSEYGLSEATITNGELSDLRICKNGSNVNGVGLFVQDEKFLKHIKKCVDDTLYELNKSRIGVA